MEFLEHYKLVLISQMGILPTLERFSSLLHRVLRTVYSLESALPKTEIDRAYLDRQHRLVAMDAGVARQYVLRSSFHRLAPLAVNIGGSRHVVDKSLKALRPTILARQHSIAGAIATGFQVRQVIFCNLTGPLSTSGQALYTDERQHQSRSKQPVVLAAQAKQHLALRAGTQITMDRASQGHVRCPKA